jgi:putative membrane protein
MVNKIIKKIEFLFFIIFIILTVGGIFAEIGFITNTPSWAPNLFMMIGSLLIFIYSKGKLKYLLIFVGLLGFFYEVLGVKTGILFGSYNYTDVFNLKILSVPIVMVSAWIIIVNFSLSFMHNIKRNYFVFLGSISMVIIDLVIDPIAVNGLEIWTWDQNGYYYGIPNHNFLGWFILSIPIFGVLNFVKEKIDIKSRIISNLVICFFSIIGFINKIYFPASLGIALILLNALLYFNEIKEKNKNAL